MRTVKTKNGATLTVAPLTTAKLADASSNLAKVGIHVKTQDAESHLSAALTAELTRLLIADYTDEAGGKPLAGIAPVAARKLILDTPGLIEGVMRVAKEQADEQAAGFEIDAGN